MKGHDFTGAPCQDNPELWESTNPWDHVEARIGCRKCDHLLPCRLLYLDVLAASDPGGRPAGTWAALFFDSRGQQKQAPDGDRPPSDYTEEQARAAHSQYVFNRRNRKPQTEWVVMGERAYQRNVKQSRRAAGHVESASKKTVDAVYEFLSREAKGGRVSATTSVIAEGTGMGRTTAHRALRVLIQRGDVVSRGGGFGETTTYELRQKARKGAA